MRTTNTGTTDLHGLSSKKEVRWIKLLEVDLSDFGGGHLRLAESRVNVEFPTGSGKTFLAAPIRIDPTTENSTGRTDALTVKIAVNDTIQGFLELHDALQGARASLFVVFPEALGDGDAVIPDVFEIDSCTVSGRVASFSLIGVQDSKGMAIAPRAYSRTFCSWQYKGRGCWQDDGEGGFEAPSGFVAGSPDTCGKTREDCQRHANYARFGAFPGVPKRPFISV